MSVDVRAAKQAVGDEELATAVGLVALGEADLPEAADRAGVTAWELVETLRAVGVVEAKNAAEL